MWLARTLWGRQHPHRVWSLESRGAVAPTGGPVPARLVLVGRAPVPRPEPAPVAGVDAPARPAAAGFAAPGPSDREGRDQTRRALRAPALSNGHRPSSAVKRGWAPRRAPDRGMAWVGVSPAGEMGAHEGPVVPPARRPAGPVVPLDRRARGGSAPARRLQGAHGLRPAQPSAKEAGEATPRAVAGAGEGMPRAAARAGEGTPRGVTARHGRACHRLPGMTPLALRPDRGPPHLGLVPGPSTGPASRRSPWRPMA